MTNDRTLAGWGASARGVPVGGPPAPESFTCIDAVDHGSTTPPEAPQ